MNKDENVLGEVFAEVKEAVRVRARIERDAALHPFTSGAAALRHKYASSVCKVLLGDIRRIEEGYGESGDGPLSPGVAGSSPKGRADLAQLIREANWNITLEESNEMAEYLMAHDVVPVLRCRDCKHGQQCGELGVICEYSQDEYRPYDAYCSFGDRRTFEEEEE
jgi:hypothetical protein